jgi:Kef-type K+ transport system membrane component KefB
VSFGDLALIVAAGLAGPLLAAGRPVLVAVVVGEILAGVAIGRTGIGAIDPGDPTLSFLSDVGFAMLMLAAGMHVPLRDRRLLAALGRGAAAAAVAGVAAIPAGLLAAEVAGTGHAAIYAVVLASGSAAIVLPILQDRGLTGPDALVVMAQVTTPTSPPSSPYRSCCSPAEPGTRRSALLWSPPERSPWSGLRSGCEGPRGCAGCG